MIRRTRRRAALGALVAGALALSGCSIYDVPLPGGVDTGKDPMKVTVMFRDVLDLVPQSTVKVDDVTVGRVTAINLKGYQAKVTIQIPHAIDLPENARAEIRQTSLLGEKFVSLSKPADPVGKLTNGDTIGLENTGRNPEVEEVFSALALLLNGGGVAQLKTIAEELNTAFGGREDEVRSVISQIRAFMSQLDANKGAIISTLENLNRLALQLRRQDGTIKLALDDIPGALRSISSQRQDLVRMLQSLSRLSNVGVRVIQASKASTIDSLQNLAPVLNEFAKAGQDFPKSLQVYLTYPFVDDAVGRNPVVARNLHMGDFTNLSVRLDIDPFNLPGLPGLPGGLSLAQLVEQCQATPLAPICQQLAPVLSGLGISLPGAPANPIRLPKPSSTSSSSGGSTGPLGGVLGGSGSGSTSGSSGGGGLLGGLFGGLGRAATGFDYSRDPFYLGPRGVDPALGTMLLQGVAVK